MADFPCPRCGASNTVNRTLKSRVAVQRNRLCDNGHLFNSTETADDVEFRVKRRNGSVEPFNVDTLRRSMRLAALGDERIPELQQQEILNQVIHESGVVAGAIVPTEILGFNMVRALLRVRRIDGLRYATAFLSNRGAVDGVEELLEWILEHLPSVKANTEPTERPLEVIKKNGRAQSFELGKVWRGIEIATKNLISTSTPTDVGAWSSREFVGAIVAIALDDLRGQPLITSGQISASVLRTLRSVNPLGFLRYATKAKAYDLPRAFVDEATGLIDHPSPSIDLRQWRDRGLELADELDLEREAIAR